MQVESALWRSNLSLKIGAVADNDSRENKSGNAASDEGVGLSARAFPFMKNPTPHRAKNNNAGHVEGPRDEFGFPHLSFSH